MKYAWPHWGWSEIGWSLFYLVLEDVIYDICFRRGPFTSAVSVVDSIKRITYMGIDLIIQSSEAFGMCSVYSKTI